MFLRLCKGLMSLGVLVSVGGLLGEIIIFTHGRHSEEYIIGEGI